MYNLLESDGGNLSRPTIPYQQLSQVLMPCEYL